ncbi:MAG TPA: tRNA uridine-5-carboxymethylaminomethyl(34) synthesis GTPase MnmE, partial [Ruminococcaceae bacterium]|nr:tRNA uridine-5-carboxymethylaminomethyl(34) synthesis GTPase MnmE [Oscillospiraceae bacterium]
MSATIAAIATPPGVGGLGVIRLSGDDAAAIADRVFSPVSGKSLREMRGYTAAYGTVFNENGRIDDAVALVFTAPKSYTGENVVELSCHGGVYLLQKVLSALYAAGAVPAQPGEFTRRAFLNGKMTLTQVESIPETIHAQGEQALHAAAMLREGALFREIQAVNSALLRICAQLSAWIDYPDEEIEDVDRADFEKIIAESTEKLTRLKNGFEQGRVLREGVATAIVGKPNVGKSTL